MHKVEPKVFLIGETRIQEDELGLYLDHIGVSEWTSDAPSDIEKIVEVMGRLCYKSFKPGLNPNVVKIREHNDEYLANVINIKHGSVIEHGMLNFILADVSRVFTHELVRHRVGVAISQESLRFVRLTNLGFWMPSVFKNHPRSEEIMRFVIEKVEFMERWQVELAEMLDIANEKDFEVKKKLTSAMRRIAPIGLATTIGWSVNVRTLRHVIEMRTHPGAEEEIRLVFGKIAEKVKMRYPNLFSDYELKIVDDLPYYETKNSKV
ncbi:MAG: FAD-dependent thymidylate synthase [Parcubacteria group bacterium]|nr:FAD-dependent thymidylate synthase [Parcubacteria group bacterium]